MLVTVFLLQHLLCICGLLCEADTYFAERQWYAALVLAAGAPLGVLL